MSSSGIDLEVLTDGPEFAALSRPRSGRGRRWAIAGGGLVLVAAVWLAFSVRSSLTRSEVGRLERQWRRAQALDKGRLTVLGDGDRVRAGDAALYREEVTRLRAIRGAVRADLLVDGRLSRLRGKMARGLAAKIGDLDRLAAWYSVTPAQTDPPPPERTPSTVAAIDEADRFLEAQLHRIGLAPRPPPGPPLFHSADSTLAFMGRILNSPTRTRLVVVTTDALLLVDIDANRITPAHLTPAPTPFQGFLALPRRTYVAVSAMPNGRSLEAIPLSLQGPVQPLPGNSIGVVAAADPDAVWLERSDGTAVEEDGRGRVLIGPVVLPNGATLIAAVDAGLVLETLSAGSPNGIAVIVWNPTTQTTERIVNTDTSTIMAVGHDTLVWRQGTTSPNHQIVHLTTISTGTDRSVSTGPHLEPTGDRWSISPDGTKIASTWSSVPSTPDAVYAPGFIDVASGRLDLAPVTLPGPAPTGIDWANSSDRIFITDNGRGTNTPVVYTYQPGSNTIEQLRLRHTAVQTIAVLPDNPPVSP